MAEFKRLVITKRGQEEIANTISNGEKISFTKIKSSEKIYSEEEMLNLITFDEVKQETEVTRTSKINETTIQIEATMNSTELSTGYNFNSLGLYANVGEEEFLYAVASVESSEKGSYIPPSTEKASSGVLLKLLNTVSTTDNINLTIDPAGVATVEEVNRVKEEVDGLKESIPKKVSDLPDAEDYVKITVDNLTNYYKKTETYTQEEVNQLVGAVKGWDIVEVTELPSQDISKSTIYLIAQDNAVSSGLVQIVNNQMVLAKTNTIISNEKIQVGNDNDKGLTISPIKNDTKDIASIASVSLPIDNYYLACVYIKETWKVIGTTKVNLSEYAKKSEIPQWIIAKDEEEAKSKSLEDPNNIYYCVEAEEEIALETQQLQEKQQLQEEA